MSKIFKTGLVAVLVSGLLFVSGCFGLGETGDIAREFFQMIADGQVEEAYEFTGDAFKDYTSYDEFVELVDLAELDTYIDFQSSGFEYSEEDGYTIQTLIGNWYDSYGYYYPIEVYFMEVGDEWKLVGFYFTE